MQKTNDYLTLPLKPTFNHFQKYVENLEDIRGFSNNNILQNCLNLGEEVGELFKAVRKEQKMKIDNNSKIGTIEEELADIFIYLCSIANRYSIDLEQAFRNKESINKTRNWS